MKNKLASFSAYILTKLSAIYHTSIIAFLEWSRYFQSQPHYSLINKDTTETFMLPYINVSNPSQSFVYQQTANILLPHTTPITFTPVMIPHYSTVEVPSPAVAKYKATAPWNSEVYGHTFVGYL